MCIRDRDNIAWYNDSYVVLTDQVAINSSLKNIYKKVGTVYEKLIRIHHKQVCEPLYKLQYLNLHTGYEDRFSGWYLKQDTKQVSRQTYNRLVVGDTGTVSYTHLDVYKRQVYIYSSGFIRKQEIV